MKHNHHIDFFSSPNSKFIGFSDIRQPKEDINHHHFVHEDEIEQDNKPYRKSSFSFMYEPIMPFQQDFFQEKLQECEEPSQYSEGQYQEIIKEDSQMKSPFIPENLLDPRPKFPGFYANRKSIQGRGSDMFSDPDENKTFLQEKVTTNFQDKYMTPKKKVEFLNSKRFTQSTAQKSATRSTQKGLRRLSTLAYSIVNGSSPTTYKQVAQKLLSRLNFDCSDLDEEQCRAQKSSMQNVKRRVYDSLNVLIALGVINRSGNKITKQKQKKNFLSGNYSDLQKYNDLLNQYKKKLINVQMKKKTERQLKQKLSIFKKTIERNRKTKIIAKNKIIKLPFLVFATNQQQQQGLNKNIEWIAKKSTQVVQKQKKKSSSKRNQTTETNQKQKLSDKLNEKINQMIVKIKFKGFPQSYGDLDFFKLIEEESFIQNLRFDEYSQENNKDKQIICGSQPNNPMQGQEYQKFELHQNQMMLNLIDEVLEYE